MTLRSEPRHCSRENNSGNAYYSPHRGLDDSLTIRQKWELTKHEVAKYKKFTNLKHLDNFELEQIDKIAIADMHPLLDLNWIRLGIQTYSTGDMVYTNLVPYSPTILFDYAWYASLIYDKGLNIPNDLFGHWLSYGAPVGISVFSQKTEIKKFSFHKSFSTRLLFSRLGKWDRIENHFDVEKGLFKKVEFLHSSSRSIDSNFGIKVT
jgi:hypothetical protein